MQVLDTHGTLSVHVHMVVQKITVEIMSWLGNKVVEATPIEVLRAVIFSSYKNREHFDCWDQVVKTNDGIIQRVPNPIFDLCCLLGGCNIDFEVTFFPSGPPHVSLAHVQKKNSLLKYMYYDFLGLLGAHVKYEVL